MVNIFLKQNSCFCISLYGNSENIFNRIILIKNLQLFDIQSFMKRILVIAKHELQLASVLNYLYESGFDSIGARQNDEALRFFDEHDPHIVIISNSVDDESSFFLKQHFLKTKPNLTILELSGGVSELKLLLSHID